MSVWTEDDSRTYREIAEVAVPRRQEMTATLVAAAPFSRDEPVKMLDLGSGDGRLAEALLTVFPRATLTALDGSESMRRDGVLELESPSLQQRRILEGAVDQLKRPYVRIDVAGF